MSKKFDEYFCEPQYFSDGALVVSGKLSAKEAAELITLYLHGEEDLDPSDVVTADNLIADRVRFGYAPEGVVDMQGELCWYAGASGKGSLPVWLFG